MKDRILEILEKNEKALSYEEIDVLLEIDDVDKTKELIDDLKALEESGEIYLSSKNKYLLFNRGPLRKGILRVNKKGYGFVDINEEEDLFIGIDNINNALHGDTVVVEINKNYDGKTEGRIVKVLKRGVQNIVGELFLNKKKAFVIPDDDNLRIEIEIAKDKTLKAVEGSKVICKINGNLNKGKAKGEIIKVIGHKTDPGVDILSIVYEYNIKVDFDPEVAEELKELATEVTEEDKKGRRDLTKEKIFTIDGDDTKDIDDAISIKKLDDYYELGVHIADVSHYVRENSALDKEALERGTSIYLVDRVIPMLDHQISNGICSLNENEERLTISCLMKIDKEGKTIDYEIFPSVISSRKQMTYKKVNDIIEKDEVADDYKEYKTEILLMDELAKILRKNKEERGYIDFAVDEAKIIVDEASVPQEVVLRERGRGENIIEDFMIQANECVARHIFYMELPFLYRVHESPKIEKVREVLAFLSSLSYSFKANLNKISPKFIQEVVNSLKDKKEFKILSSLILRSMQKAIYLPQNLGHFGLASKCYTHFTAPIRRYPDLTVHRLLRTYLFDNDISNKSVNYWKDRLAYIAERSSELERNSIDCEREVESMKMAEYMENHIGEEYEAMISGLANYGIFVQLDNLIEGLVPISELKDHYNYDEEKQILTSDNKKKSFRLGDSLRVKVIRASKEKRTIDFTIVGE